MEKRASAGPISWSRSAFGRIPIQHVAMEESDALLRRAFKAGVNIFDTARLRKSFLSRCLDGDACRPSAISG